MGARLHCGWPYDSYLCSLISLLQPYTTRPAFQSTHQSPVQNPSVDPQDFRLPGETLTIASSYMKPSVKLNLLRALLLLEICHTHMHAHTRTHMVKQTSPLLVEILPILQDLIQVSHPYL